MWRRYTNRLPLPFFLTLILFNLMLTNHFCHLADSCVCQRICLWTSLGVFVDPGISASFALSSERLVSGLMCIVHSRELLKCRCACVCYFWWSYLCISCYVLWIPLICDKTTFGFFTGSLFYSQMSTFLQTQMSARRQHVSRQPFGIDRVPTPPGKSWIFSWKFQDLESPEKSLWSWKVLEIKA